MVTIAPHGSWKSPVTAELLIAQTVGLSEPSIDGDKMYWLESRPKEQGRRALVQRDAEGRQQDVLPGSVSVCSRVNEYGGSSYLVCDSVIYYVDFSDQRIYRASATHDNRSVVPITPEGPYRYADLCLDSERERIVCVREDLSTKTDKGGEETSAIVAISIQREAHHEIEILVDGDDFYSNPRICPDGRQLSWLAWNHPNMPWDSSECWVAQIGADGALNNVSRVAGGDSESIAQPEWSPNGDLYLVSDRTNWWNIYRWTGSKLEILCEMDAEFAAPRWMFGMQAFGFLDGDSLFCSYTQNGEWHLGKISLRTKTLTKITSPFRYVMSVACHDSQAILLASSATEPLQLVAYRADDQGKLRAPSVLAHSSPDTVDPGYISIARGVTYPVGTEGDQHAHGFYYAPRNADYQGPKNAKPPLLVLVHGGPTMATASCFGMRTQYWTSRGFAVLDVNYRGSNGFGREYRDRLKYNWGVTDVEDVIAGVDFVVEQGLADPDRIAIMGSSAGGFTVLSALVLTDRFKAGTSMFGISNLEDLVKETHKLESKYFDSLVGPYPNAISTYRERSPINHVDQLTCPTIFFQGLADKVVAPDQSKKMAEALRNKGIATAYITFEDEGHGFVRAESIKRVFEGQLYFYSKIFGFDISDKVEAVAIDNLESITDT